MPTVDEPTDSRSPLARLLGLVTEVRPGEATLALALALDVFVLLVGYYVLKTVREPLVQATGGAELATYASAAQAVTLIGFVPLYAWFAARVDRRRLILGLGLFYGLGLEAFYLGWAADVPFLGFVFFVWLGIFSVSTVAQFWSLANDVYSREDGERLFPLVGIGATAGAPVGAFAAGALFAREVSVGTLMQIAVVLFAIHVGLALVIEARASRSGTDADKPLDRGRGFALVLGNPYLRWIALLFVLLNVVNTLGEFVLRSSVNAAAAEIAATDPEALASFTGAFWGGFFSSVNIATLLIQALLVSRIVRHAGMAGILLLLPLVSGLSNGLVIAGAGFAVFRWTKLFENATDYSVMNTGKAMLWLPTTREEKYQAKQAVDTFFVRFGDVIAAAVVFLGLAALGHESARDLVGEDLQQAIRVFAGINLVVIVGWIGVAFALLRGYTRLAGEDSTPEPTG